MVEPDFEKKEIVLRWENNHVIREKLKPWQMEKVKEYLKKIMFEPNRRPPRRRNQRKKDVSLRDLFKKVLTFSSSKYFRNFK